MERRELLKMIALVTGGAFIGGEMLLSGCTNESSKIGGATFTPEDIAFMDEVGETILPKTKSPGAKDAEIGKFMTVMVNDCYSKDDQATFHEGLKKLDEASEKKNNTSFMKSTPEQRTALLMDLDKESKDYQKERGTFNKAEDDKAKADKAYKKQNKSPHYFTMLKQLTLFGFFTSKPGETEALRHIAVPGKYDGDFAYQKGDRAWAE